MWYIIKIILWLIAIWLGLYVFGYAIMLLVALVFIMLAAIGVFIRG